MSATQKESYTTRFLFGGTSCMIAACFTNPIDVAKVRLQLQGELSKSQGIYSENLKYQGFIRTMFTIHREEGIRGLYKGLSASLLREGSYSTLRMGGYDMIKAQLGETDPSRTPLLIKIFSGAVSGSIGAAIANPSDLVKVRMQATTTQRYSGLMSAFSEIIQKEGFLGLYKGTFPSTARAALLTATQLPAYDHTKHFLLRRKILKKDNIFAHFVCSMFAGLAAAITTSPFDVIKTRFMNQPCDAAGQPLIYKSTLDTVYKIVSTEGPMGLYKGFFPNWMRIGPHTIVTFMVYEYLRHLGGVRAI